MEYAEIFGHRGDAYHGAMQKSPNARRSEFEELFRYRPVRRGETVLDVPAGGGYLARMVPDARVTMLEFSGGFSAGVPVVETYGEWDVGLFDRCVCLASMHHIEDQERFASQLVRHTRPGGTVHIADVDRSSPLGRYLDGFVGRYNVTGHEGRYLTADSFRGVPGTRLLRSEIRSCPWTFASENELLDFCNNLFGLIDCPREVLRSHLAELVGLSRDGAAHVVNWRLRYIDLEIA